MHKSIIPAMALVVALTVAFVLGVGLALGIVRPQTVAEPPRFAPAPPLAQAARSVPAGESDFSDIADAVTPAVVRIEAIRSGSGGRGGLERRFRDLFGVPPGAGEEGPPPPRLAGGSGVIVSEDGYILTNNHVVAEADRITVTLVDKRSFEATLIGRDPTTDLAVIRVDTQPLSAAFLGDSDAARVGEWVLAIGNPGFGPAGTLDFTVTGGIISAKGRPLDIINRELMAGASPAVGFAIEDFLQTDAVINPGNSGGPLVNLRGEVIGINTAIASGTGFYQGYGFAIPSNLARRVLADLIDHGRVQRAMLGVSIAEIGEVDAELYGLADIAGVLVEDFPGRSPAEDSGLKRHDVIVRLGGWPVERVGQLQRLVAQHRPGELVEVDIVRYGQPHRFNVRLGEVPLPREERPRPARPVARPDDLGIEVTDLTRAMARQMGLNDGSAGAVIVRIAPGSPAARKLQRGDRIVSINGESVDGAADAEARLRQAGSGEIVSLEVSSPEGRTRIANLRMP